MMITDTSLHTILRGERPTVDVSDTTASGSLYGATVERIGSLVVPAQGALMAGLRLPGQHVIEVAAGSSPWGRALCADDPTTRITAIDLPEVIGTTRRSADAAGVSSRYDFVAGDVFAIDDIGPVDLVVVAGFCRLIGADRNAALFHRIAAWCRPGGRVAVIDAVATNAARAAGLSSYELSLLTRTSTGRCWSLDHYARWMTDAGFATVELVSTDRPEVTLLTAHKGDRP